MADERARPELPPVVARMWGREPVSRRGPKPSLDLARITTAAMEIADAEGLSSVSMSSVAARLGVAPMSLYRYVGSKDELLVAMLDAVSEEPPPLGDLSRREYLYAWTKANADLLVSRPWTLSIARGGPPMGPRGLRWLDRLLSALADTPLHEGEKIGIATTLSGYALSQASLIIALAPERVGTHLPPSSTVYGELLAELVDEDSYPALTSAVRSQAFVADPSDWYGQDTDFRFGLDLLLDGIEALIASRTPSADTRTPSADTRA
ncbi:TetR/AcrR family transcriptional regulator [Saccharomonospora xinjiangensis]|uniref:Transcriptional regulator n=1 Tax=Saccharomonospora xinjiangensis XJ-54 TaxID=882086 RepID=I0V2B5_9PSEU|nr:TetR/AcrR family transcriptional regulator [Saccharomonospora xinjiangensis]EID54268.1 transcriptional regulator [Saccharomonospora xinjiangensis XJ-54]